MCCIVIADSICRTATAESAKTLIGLVTVNNANKIATRLVYHHFDIIIATAALAPCHEGQLHAGGSQDPQSSEGPQSLHQSSDVISFSVFRLKCPQSNTMLFTSSSSCSILGLDFHLGSQNKRDGRDRLEPDRLHYCLVVEVLPLMSSRRRWQRWCAQGPAVGPRIDEHVPSRVAPRPNPSC